MKKFVFSTAVIALALLSVACQKEINPGQEEELFPKVFTGIIENGFKTKSQIHKEDVTPVVYKTWWENTDKVRINGATYATTPTGGSSTQATFTLESGTPSAGEGYTAYFPASTYTRYDETLKKDVLTLPATQSRAGSFDLNTPMYAYSTTTSLSFKNLCAVLAIKITKPEMEYVKTIRISSSNKAISGEFTVEETSGTPYAKLTDAAQTAKNSVVLECASDVYTHDTGTIFYVTIPAQTYQNLKIELSADGTNYTKRMTTKKDTDIAVSVNTVYPITFRSDFTGTAQATIGGETVNVNWVQLMADGPKFARCNYGADNQSEKSLGTAVNFSEACSLSWGGNWETSKDVGSLANMTYITCIYCEEGGVYGFKFTGVGDYAGNSLFLPADSGSTESAGTGHYWSSDQYETQQTVYGKCLVLEYKNGTVSRNNEGFDKSNCYYVRLSLK